MATITDTTVVKTGLKCPHCGTIGEVGDAACVNGDFDFPDNYPVSGLNAAGEVVELDGLPVSASKPAPAPAPVAPPVVAPAPAAPVVSAPTSGSKTCWLDVRVDTSPRAGRPPEGDADYDAPPTWASFRFDLKAPIVRFGRLPILAGGLTVSGDGAVSKFQGDFVRLPDGSYKVQHNANANPIFVAGSATHAGTYVPEGGDYVLMHGDKIQVGDWIEIEYSEETAV